MPPLRQRWSPARLPALARAAGARVVEEICGSCWKEWMGVQTKIINEYRINVLHPEHAEAVKQQMEVFFGFREAPPQ
ncbi:MAG: hypothetical protein HC882_09780 [Acidobacteria bacterium]|nr:hypothetical protein [Acidobacteriota bacterium]